MSPTPEDAKKIRETLKQLFIQLHEGQAPDIVKNRLVTLLGQVPYQEVVAVEQELLADGIRTEEIMKMCDVHMEALKGQITKPESTSMEEGHPLAVFRQENQQLRREISPLVTLLDLLDKDRGGKSLAQCLQQMQEHFQRLQQVEKHYKRKENLLFPILEKHRVTGPSTVMWGKHDEVRKGIKSALDALKWWETMTLDEALSVRDLVLKSAANAVEEMIVKEEEVLFPMSKETLSPEEWHFIQRQSAEIGFTLIPPPPDWQPLVIVPAAPPQPPAPSAPHAAPQPKASGRIELPSGALDTEELTALLNSLPVDITFVDADDRVRYFSEGRDRFFTRTRAVIGRQVRHCHPPKSLPVVERILDDFKSGRESRAAFWITLEGRFIHIEYIALRGESGKYLGCIEVSQDLTAKRKLKGQRRLLNYGHEKK